MTHDDVKQRVDEIRKSAHKGDWFTAKQLIEELHQRLTETPADIRGHWY